VYLVAQEAHRCDFGRTIPYRDTEDTPISLRKPKAGERSAPLDEGEEAMNIGEEHELIIAEPVEAPAELPEEAPGRREGHPVPA
jgi:hypothetical protein